jgi:zinc protease
LAARKQGEIGSYFVSLSTTLGLAETILVNAQRGYDPGWLDAYPKALKALTRDQVNAAIRTHINPNSMVLVEAGSVPAAAK